MHSLAIDYRRLGGTLWWRQNNDVTENQGAARSLYIVFSKGQFSNQNINKAKEAEIILKNIDKCDVSLFKNKQSISFSLKPDFGRWISL